MTRVDALLREGAALAVDSARLDAELLLAECLQRDRVWLRAWPEAEVAPDREQQYRALLGRRASGEPMAYLLGRREFWSLPLAVAPGVLVPRPESERLVELALELGPSGAARVLDLGTGSGALALALASERPEWVLWGVDVDPGNVALATANAGSLGLGNAHFGVSDWFAALRGEFDLIIANPPYIAADDPHLRTGDLLFEPHRALVAADGGLAALRHIAAVAPRYLVAGAWLLLEHGWQQGAAVGASLAAAQLEGVHCWRDHGGRDRVSGGRRPQGLETGA